jgi:hypothetical protein
MINYWVNQGMRLSGRERLKHSQSVPPQLKVPTHYRIFISRFQLFQAICRDWSFVFEWTDNGSEWTDVSFIKLFSMGSSRKVEERLRLSAARWLRI